MIRGLMLARLDRLDDARATIQRGRRAAETLGIADALPVFHYQAGVRGPRCAGGSTTRSPSWRRTRSSPSRPHIGWHLSAESLRALIALHRDDLLAAERHVAAAEREVAAGAPPFGTDLMVLARARSCSRRAGDARRRARPLAATFDALGAGAATFLPVLGPELARLRPSAAGEPGAGRAGRARGCAADRRPESRRPQPRSRRAAGARTARRRRAGAARRRRAAARTGRALETARAAGGRGRRSAATARASCSRTHADLRRAAARRATSRASTPRCAALGARRGVDRPAAAARDAAGTRSPTPS